MLENTEKFGKPTIQLLLWEQDTKTLQAINVLCYFAGVIAMNVSLNFTFLPLTAVRL